MSHRMSAEDTVAAMYITALHWLIDNLRDKPVHLKRSSAVRAIAAIFGRSEEAILKDVEALVNAAKKPVRSVGEVRRERATAVCGVAGCTIREPHLHKPARRSK